MGVNGFAWVIWGAGTRGDRETRGKEAQMIVQDNIWRCMITAKKIKKSAAMISSTREGKGGEC